MSFAGSPSLPLNVQTTSHDDSLTQSLKQCSRVNDGREAAHAADRWLPMDLADLKGVSLRKIGFLQKDMFGKTLGYRCGTGRRLSDA
ncbi:hypothetical protein L3X38_039708 [Prunus dulcis]|uniref:Uncharacterized protein n=1 Tax=Prunus dulcis TaxID=3755 RepID=A0AAD4V7N0_PRUDU|nr:hypothetical protein L3X38_039708 [Prunus dulcis]